MKKNLGLSLIVAFLSLACSAREIQKNLAPEDKDFLLTVRYIITKQEKKAFLDLAPSERRPFIEEFWKKRDLTPATEVNEYKDEYLKRVKEAKHLFSGEGGASGWLQDRGRIYILLGPPEQRETYPRGEDLRDIPVEYWHYGFHVLTFRDYRKNGSYELQEGPRMLAEISQTQEQLNPGVKPERVSFDFDLDIKKPAEKQLLILISIPYDNIWLSAEGNELTTSLELSLDVFDSAEKKVREEAKIYPISFAKEELKELMGQDYLIEIPVELDPGKYRATITLKNVTGQAKVKKTITFTIPFSDWRAL
jgi:GWxTD domain-containing protein